MESRSAPSWEAASNDARSGDRSRSPDTSDVHYSTKGNGILITRTINEETIELDTSSGIPEMATDNGRRIIVSPDEFAAFQTSLNEDVVDWLSEVEPDSSKDDGFNSWRIQVPDGLSVMLDSTTLRNAVYALRESCRARWSCLTSRHFPRLSCASTTSWRNPLDLGSLGRRSLASNLLRCRPMW